jgi:hypothetical protein
METEAVSETLDFCYELIQLIAREECSSSLSPFLGRLITFVL